MNVTCIYIYMHPLFCNGIIIVHRLHQFMLLSSHHTVCSYLLPNINALRLEGFFTFVCIFMMMACSHARAYACASAPHRADAHVETEICISQIANFVFLVSSSHQLKDLLLNAPQPAIQ